MNDTKIINCNQLFDKFINNIDLENILWQITSDQYEWQV